MVSVCWALWVVLCWMSCPVQGLLSWVGELLSLDEDDGLPITDGGLCGMVACVGWWPIWCGVVRMFWCIGSIARRNAIPSTSKDNFNSSKVNR